MANNPSTLVKYNGQIDAPTTEYPYGSARDDAVPGDLTGTPRVAAELKDLQGFQQSILAASGIVPTGSADEVGASQYLDGMLTLSTRSVATVALMTADMPTTVTTRPLSSAMYVMSGGEVLSVDEFVRDWRGAGALMEECEAQCVE